MLLDPEDRDLGFVAAFLQSDVDIVLPSCDLLLEEITAVQEGRQPRWAWNGNSYLVEVEKDHTNIIDKYGDGPSVKATVDTALLCFILRQWKRFVSDLPRQRELPVPGPALHHN
jgi:hypothetical protein